MRNLSYGLIGVKHKEKVFSRKKKEFVLFIEKEAIWNFHFLI